MEFFETDNLAEFLIVNEWVIDGTNIFSKLPNYLYHYRYRNLKRRVSLGLRFLLANTRVLMLVITMTFNFFKLMKKCL